MHVTGTTHKAIIVLSTKEIQARNKKFIENTLKNTRFIDVLSREEGHIFQALSGISPGAGINE